nr:AAA family ATPase [Bradyrhizobium frederickii]
MARYVADELERRRLAGAPADVWLFPAMELTAKHGCQCIILFDADLPLDWQAQAQAYLGIATAAIDPQSASAKQPTPLDLAYWEIDERLKKHTELQGRYIILPNVSDGGNSVLRKNFHDDFRKMPYVGGYLDAGQVFDTCSPTNKARLSGTAPHWGDRFVYPIPTSDSRDHSRLGSNNTWVKLSSPKAEALRQAFLAWKSRIRTEQPSYATVVIERFSVVGTSPLAETSIHLSPELNSVIGGRGTCKSTLLEYIAFSVGRSCFDLPDKDFSGKHRLASLIQDTLISQGAGVEAHILIDGAQFKVTRSFKTGYQPRLTYPNGKEEVVSPQELRNLIPGYAYSQGELSEVGGSTAGTRVSDLLAFISPHYKTEAETLEKNILAAKQKHAEALRSLLALWQLEDEKRRLENKVAATRARIVALESTLPALQEADQKTLDTHNQLLVAMEQVERSVEDISAIEDSFDELSELLAGIQELDATTIAEVSAVAASIKALQSYPPKVASLGKSFGADAQAVRDTGALLQAHINEHAKRRDAVLATMSRHKATAGQVAELQKQVTVEVGKLGALEKRIKALADPSVIVRKTQDSLSKTVVAQAEKYKEWASIIESLSNGIVQVRVDDFGDLEEIHAALEIVSARTRSQEGVRVRRFAELVSQSDVWKIIHSLRAECAMLMRWKIDGDNDQSKLPPLANIGSVVGDGEAVKKALIDQFDETRLMAIAQSVPKAKVHLDYKSDQLTVPFDKASEGQRAAVLLMMLLKQEGGPLIVDQPESDLDNAVITDVVDLLHEVKCKRQLIFATHNANLVVNGASEYVASMCNDHSGLRKCECDGSIDANEVRLAITTTMEGGRQAFQDRQRKYGF